MFLKKARCIYVVKHLNFEKFPVNLAFTAVAGVLFIDSLQKYNLRAPLYRPALGEWEDVTVVPMLTAVSV